MGEQPVSQDRYESPVRTIVEFCRFARANGLEASTKETLGCLEALRNAHITDIPTLKFALRAVLCSSKEAWDLFDDLFNRFWQGDAARRAGESRTSSPHPSCAEMVPRKGSLSLVLGANGVDSGVQPREEAKTVAGASRYERLRKIDFSEVPQQDMADLERIAQRLLRQMSRRVSRRLKPTKSRSQVDLRRTIRLNVSRGGEPIDLSHRGRRSQQPRLVVLLDVSGSMNLYSLFLLRFAYALAICSDRIAAFIFSTCLIEITRLLRAQRLTATLQALSETTAGWSGGTRIGASLLDFNRTYGRRLLSRHSYVIILSDGWDTGEPELLSRELRAIKRRVSQLIWLNPLLGLEHYEPVTRGMSAALPYVDVFAPAHNLESLLDLEYHLR
jgi:uncharacterized protein with von Willebrand factor type A (vWA) domain